MTGEQYFGTSRCQAAEAAATVIGSRLIGFRQGTHIALASIQQHTRDSSSSSSLRCTRQQTIADHRRRVGASAHRKAATQEKQEAEQPLHIWVRDQHQGRERPGLQSSRGRQQGSSSEAFLPLPFMSDIMQDSSSFAGTPEYESFMQSCREARARGEPEAPLWGSRGGHRYQASAHSDKCGSQARQSAARDPDQCSSSPSLEDGRP